MKKMMFKLEELLEVGGMKKDIVFLVIGGVSLLLSLMNSRFPFLPLPFDIAWLSILFCGIPIILEAVIGLTTRFDIKADVLVSLALIASIFIHEDFAAGEVAFIMQLGALLEDLTVARARAGIEKLVQLTPQTARVISHNEERIIPAEQVQLKDILRVLQLVQSADADKAKIVGLADRWATWIVVIALSAATLTWLFTGQIIRAVTILVVFCPCALVLATPTAIMAAIGNATKHGFLVREGDALERLAGVRKITFDKTGTLTYGTPVVTAVKSLSSYSEAELYAYAASVEKMSEHPLGKAIVHCYGKETLPVQDFHMEPGEGVSAVIDGKTIHAGNAKLFNRIHLNTEVAKEAEIYLSDGSTVIYMGIDGKLAGFIVLSDTLRTESCETIQKIRALHITPVLLTGDHENAALNIAKKVGITELRANCLPEDKLTAIEEAQKRGESVSMIGDGINDAPALKKADVGIAMGGIGSDIAVDAADIALVDDEIKELPHLLALSKRMMKTIKINLSFSMALNFLAIVLAITGILGPVVGALVHNAGSVLVIINSALLLKWKAQG